MRDLSESSMEQLWEYAGSEDKEDRACALRELGRRKLNEKAASEGEELLRESTRVWQELDNQLELALTQYALGHCLIRRGENQQAEEAFETAGFNFQFSGHFGYLPDTEYWLGQARYFQKKYSDAGLAYNRAIRSYPPYAHLEIAAARMGAGLANMAQFESMLAAGDFHVAHDEFNEAEEYEEAAHAWVRYAFAMSDSGWNQDALQAMKQALESFEYLENEQEVAYSYQRVGIMLENMDLFPQAIEYYEKSVVACKKHGDSLRAAESEINIAVCLAKIGNWNQATAKLDKLDSFVEVSGNTFTKAALQYARGAIASEKKLWADAIIRFTQCRELCAQDDDLIKLEWDAMLQLHELFVVTNRLQEAYQIGCAFSVADFGSLTPVRVAYGITSADYNLACGHFDDASECIREAIKQAKLGDMPEELKRARSLQRKITAAKKSGA